jgi:hypothetical protein
VPKERAGGNRQGEEEEEGVYSVSAFPPRLEKRGDDEALRAETSDVRVSAIVVVFGQIWSRDVQKKRYFEAKEVLLRVFERLDRLFFFV